MKNRYRKYFEPMYKNIAGASTIVLASDITPVAYNEMRNGGEFNGACFIENLKEILQPHQTLLIPVYNWDFCKGMAFNYKTSKSQTGILGDYALQDKDFKRTKHPIYSFAAHGKDKDELCSSDYKSSFGSNSLFGYMYDKKALHIGIGIRFYMSFTFVHYVEEVYFLNEITYRYIKNFRSKYIDETGKESIREYSMLVRDLDKNVRMDLRPLGESLEEKGIMNTYELDGVHLYDVDIYKSFDIIKDDIASNKSRKFCIYDGQ